MVEPLVPTIRPVHQKFANWYSLGYSHSMSTPSVASATYEQLLLDLQRGTYPPGSRLPGERDLSASLGISRGTLRATLTRLEAEGILERSAQRGWFIPQTVIGEPPSTLQSFSEMARSRGLAPSAKVLSTAVRPATIDEATKLRMAPAAPVFAVDRLRSMDSTPVCVDKVVMPEHLVHPLVDLDLTDRSLYVELKERCGIEIQRSAYSVQAVPADDVLTWHLGLAPGAPVLVGREVAYTAEGTAVLVGVNHYRGDAYIFEADLFR